MTDESSDRARELDEALVMHEPDPLLKSDPLAPRPDAPTVALKLARLCGECEAIFEAPREECPKCASRSYVPVAGLFGRDRECQHVETMRAVAAQPGKITFAPGVYCARCGERVGD